MAAIPIVGECFGTPESFLKYLEGVKFNLWRPRFVTLHHTGTPDLKTWQGWQTRAKPVTDEQWLKNLAHYYGNPAFNDKGKRIKGAWSAGPHFFVTPKNICVLSPPTARGVHAASFNAVSWGVECVGDFDREKLDGPVKELLIGALAAMHIAAGLQAAPYERGVRGLHFHRDDPQTSKTCPGKNVSKSIIISEINKRIAEMTGGAHDDEHVAEKATPSKQSGVVNTNDLNVRAAASAKAPPLRKLNKGAKVSVLASAMNGATRWLSIGDGEWVAAAYVDLA